MSWKSKINMLDHQLHKVRYNCMKKKTGRICYATIKYLNRKKVKIEEPPISHFDKSLNEMEKKDESNLGGVTFTRNISRS